VSQLPDDDDRWLLLAAYEGPAKSELYLRDLKAGTPPVEISSGKDFNYTGEIFRGKLYITTNEDAPHYRLFVVDAAIPPAPTGRKSFPAGDGILQGIAMVDGKLLAQYERTPAHN